MFKCVQNIIHCLLQTFFQPYPFAGAYIEEELAYQMALGNVDLNTLTIVSHYDPGKNDN